MKESNNENKSFSSTSDEKQPEELGNDLNAENQNSSEESNLDGFNAAEDIGNEAAEDFEDEQYDDLDEDELEENAYEDGLIDGSEDFAEGEENLEKTKEQTKPFNPKLKKVLLKIVLPVVSVILVLSIVTSILFTSGTLNSKVTALTIGGYKVSVTEYNFYYFSVYQSFLSNYGDQLSYIGLDTSKPLSEQKYSDSMTWDQYFKQQAISYLKQTIGLCNEAKKNSYSLADTDRQGIEDDFSNLKAYCQANNIDFKQYITSAYGKGTTEATMRFSLEREYLASSYYNHLVSSYQYSDNDLETGYLQNKDSIDLIDYRSFFFPIENNDSDTAKNKANEMLAQITDSASFARLSEQYASDADKETYKSDSATLSVGLSKQNASYVDANLTDWLYSVDTTQGSKAVVQSDSGFYVAMMISRYRPETPTVSVRHILIQPVITGSTATDEEKAAAHQSAQDLMNSWLSGGGTEDQFAELAESKSQDEGSASNGGLYENISQGQMVPQFDAWCFDSSRKVGDYGLVDTDYGTHVMYFSAVGEPLWKINTKQLLNTQRSDQVLTDATKDLTVKESSFGLKLAGKRTDTVSSSNAAAVSSDLGEGSADSGTANSSSVVSK